MNNKYLNGERFDPRSNPPALFIENNEHFHVKSHLYRNGEEKNLVPFPINDTPFVKTFLINEEKGDESKRRKEGRNRENCWSFYSNDCNLPASFLTLLRTFLCSDSLLQRIERKEKEKHGIEQSSLEDFIPDSLSFFFLSLCDYLSQMDRETKKEGFKWQICTRNSENYINFLFSFSFSKSYNYTFFKKWIMEFLNLDFKVFLFFAKIDIKLI